MTTSQTLWACCFEFNTREIISKRAIMWHMPFLSLPQRGKTERGHETGKQRREMEHPLGPIDISRLIRERVSEGWPFFLKLSVPPAGQAESKLFRIIEASPSGIEKVDLFRWTCCTIRETGWHKPQPEKRFNYFFGLSIFVHLKLLRWLTGRVILLIPHYFSAHRPAKICTLVIELFLVIWVIKK